MGEGEAFWRGRIARAHVTLLGRIDGPDLGVVVVADAWDDPQAAALYGLWVDPMARGTGLGEGLVRGAIEAARQAGCPRLVLEVGDWNEAAIRLYARLGFERTGRHSTLAPPREHVTEHERERDLRY